MVMGDTNLLHFLDSFSNLKVLVIGEAMLDSYLHGTTDRLCREAPVPVVSVTDREHLPGGAANAAVNIRALGAEVHFLSAIGPDLEGTLLLEALEEKQVSTENIIIEQQWKTLAKQRVIAASQMVVRFDQGNELPMSEETEKALIKHLVDLYPEVDAVIVSDYDYGVLTKKVIQTLADLQAKNPRLLLVDSKRLCEYKDVQITAVKPNFAEAVEMLDLHKPQSKEERIALIMKEGPRILKETKTHIAAITLDREGALIFERGVDQPYRTYAHPAPNSKAAGAGDTFMSAFALALAAGAPTENAAEIASAAATIVVEKDGTSACQADELRRFFSNEEKYLTDVFQLAARLAELKRNGKSIVFTNGCFDILHRGHITYLNRAKTFGDVLIIGLNSDDSVRRLKGPTRPINTLEDRAQVLSALSSVDHIVAFDGDTPHELIRAIKPDVFVKGGDYNLTTLPEASLVMELGGRVEILPYLADRSTTNIIERIRSIDTEPASTRNEARS